MPTYVVLLRAVNVGGRVMRMEAARSVLEQHSFANVASHIQSGNLLLTTPLRSPAKVESAVGECLSEAAGFDIVAMARRPDEVKALVTSVDGIPAAFPGDVQRYVAFCQDDRASATVALRAAFLGAGEAALPAQILEQRVVRRGRCHLDQFTVQQESQRMFRHGRLSNPESSNPAILRRDCLYAKPANFRHAERDCPAPMRRAPVGALRCQQAPVRSTSWSPW